MDEIGELIRAADIDVTSGSVRDKLRRVPDGVQEPITVSLLDLATLVARCVRIGRQEGIRLQHAPPEMSDTEIDAVLAAALGTWCRQERWLEIVGRPVARAILAHVKHGGPTKPAPAGDAP